MVKNLKLILKQFLNLSVLHLYKDKLRFMYVCIVNTLYMFRFVEISRQFTIAELWIRKLGSSSVLMIGSKALQ